MMRSEQKRSPPPMQFESPRNAKPALSSHTFKCKCSPSPEPFACERAYKWLNLAWSGKEFDPKRNRELYLGLLGTEKISGSENQIKLDIARTFP